MDRLANWQAKLNYEHVCDLKILLELVCILPLKEFVYVFIKLAQMRNVFVCNLVATIKVCQGDSHNTFYDNILKFIA